MTCGGRKYIPLASALCSSHTWPILDLGVLSVPKTSDRPVSGLVNGQVDVHGSKEETNGREHCPHHGSVSDVHKLRTERR